jgi:hypothetical protein
MWQRILSFLGWLWTGFFVLVGLVSLTKNPVFALTFMVWGLIFLPPLFRFTLSYGWVWNIGGRIAAFFISVIIAAVFTPAQPQVTQSTLPATTTPNAEITVGKTTPTPTLTPTTELTPTIQPTPIPEVIETSEPEVTPEAETTPDTSQRTFNSTSEPVTPSPQDNPDAAVRNAVSGSCDCPYDTDRRGRSCGARSAYSRNGGRGAVCYVRDRQ